jgi:hypothetical protein
VTAGVGVTAGVDIAGATASPVVAAVRRGGNGISATMPERRGAGAVSVRAKRCG